MPAPVAKATGAFRTIGELSRETGLPPHILRFWETRFEQLKPLTRAGQRRYYRPEDVALVRRIDRLLNREGYSVRGVKQLLAGTAPIPHAEGAPVQRLRTIRDALADALASDGVDGADDKAGPAEAEPAR